MDDIIFRQAGFTDYPHIAALHTASWRSTYQGILPKTYLEQEIEVERRTMWKARLGAPNAERRYIALAERGENPLGFVCVLLDENPQWGAYLDNLHVHPEYKRHGLGRRLFALAVRWVLRVQPDQPLHLWVFEANHPSRRFYEAFHGKVQTCETKIMPGGAMVASVCYIWHDLPRLLGQLSAR